MGIDSAGPKDRRGKSRRGRIAGVAVTLVVMAALAVAPSALASETATAKVARIGTGSYLVTVTNTGTEAITLFTIGSDNGFVAGSEGFAPASIVPTTCHSGAPIAGAIGCPGLAPGSSQQVCYTGPAATNVSILFPFGFPTTLTPTSAPTLSSCPLPGFTAPPVAKHKKHHKKKHHKKHAQGKSGV
jgi:hypothetical protein